MVIACRGAQAPALMPQIRRSLGTAPLNRLSPSRSKIHRMALRYKIEMNELFYVAEGSRHCFRTWFHSIRSLRCRRSRNLLRIAAWSAGRAVTSPTRLVRMILTRIIGVCLQLILQFTAQVQTVDSRIPGNRMWNEFCSYWNHLKFFCQHLLTRTLVKFHSVILFSQFDYDQALSRGNVFGAFVGCAYLRSPRLRYGLQATCSHVSTEKKVRKPLACSKAS